MNLIEATSRYERWLAGRLPLLRPDLQLKHRRMALDPFSFLRGSFYRWAQLWPQQCADLALAPRVLGVGDLHVENFGTWRDEEGRLIWGVNDFDEATMLPYTADLVRLGASALIAGADARLGTSARRASEALLHGYTQSLREGGGPVVLAERHRWLRELAVGRLQDQRAFWERLLALRTVSKPVPAVARGLLAGALPERHLRVRIVHRQAGLGSLGRQRFTALAEWRGGLIAREVKPLTESAWHWDRVPARAGFRPRYSQILRGAVRVADPFLAQRAGWVVRRLAPDCSRVELTRLARVRDECRLLWMMGWETGNVHLGTRARRQSILRDLGQRKADWLLRAARTMRAVTMSDWRKWRGR